MKRKIISLLMAGMMLTPAAMAEELPMFDVPDNEGWFMDIPVDESSLEDIWEAEAEDIEPIEEWEEEEPELPVHRAESASPFQLNGDVLVRYTAQDKEITIPDGVRVIGEKAFDGCLGLERVTLCARVEIISDNAFRGCAALKELIVPEGCTLKQIGSRAFEGTLVDPASVEAEDIALDAFGDPEMPEDDLFFDVDALLAAADELDAAIAADTGVVVYEAAPLDVTPGEWNMSADGKSVFIQKPTISGGSGSYTIAYNIYDDKGNAINYFYSTEEWVAATCPANGRYIVFVVVRDGSEEYKCSTGWFDVTGYSGLTVGDLESTMSPDGRSCFIKRPDISGGTGSYTIAYNIYDSNSQPVNYFYSNEEYVAATCPYNGIFNVFVVVSDGSTSVTKDTGWFEVGSHSELDAPVVTSIAGVNSATKAMTIQWEPVVGADTYEVQYYQTNEEWQTLCFTNDTEYQGGDFKSGAVYYFRVRGLAGNAEGEWSEVMEGSRPYIKGELVVAAGEIGDIQFTMSNYASLPITVQYYCGFYTTYTSAASHSKLETIMPKTTASNNNRELPSLKRYTYHYKPYYTATLEQTASSMVVLPFTYAGHTYYMQFTTSGSSVWVLRDE